MAANVLRGSRAVQISVFVVRAFVRLREDLTSYENIRAEIDAMRVQYDQKFSFVFNAIEALFDGPRKGVRIKGFRD